MGQPERTVIHADATQWLAEPRDYSGCSFVTSLPDVSEVSVRSLQEWRKWFIAAARQVVEVCPADGVAIFFQSDIKKDGRWFDKGYLVQKAAEEAGAELLWHKIVCRQPPGTITFGRAAYSHLLCFSRGVRLDLARSTADVLPEAGEMTWVRAMGLDACRAACRWIQANTRSRTIVDPYCGVGTALAVANELGFAAIGVELNRKRAAQARTLTVPAPQP